MNRVLKRQTEFNPRLNPLLQEIQSIRCGRKGLDEEAENALPTYAKSACRALSDKVYTAFPREIRDIIYGYLLPYSMHLDNSITPTQMISRLYLGDEGFYRWSPKISISLKQPGYFSMNMAKEIVEALLRTSTFKFNKDDLRDIPEFRVTDSLGVGIVPADYMLDLHVFNNCSRYAFKGLRHLREERDEGERYGMVPQV